MTELPRDTESMSVPAVIRGWGRGPVVALLCVGFYFVLLASVWNKGLTFDEPRHATAGYSYWKVGDYRLDPEIGVLANRVLALPLLLCGQPLPSLESEAWRTADERKMGDLWFNQSGDGVTLLRVGRAGAGLFAIVLALFLWRQARRLGGAIAAFVALGLYLLSPTVLANGAFMTSDILISALFLISIVCLWELMQEVTWRRLLCSAAATAALFAVKNSALAVVPVAVGLVGLRVGSSQPLSWSLWGCARVLESRSRRFGGLMALALVHVFVGWALMWGLYGFRFSAFAQDQVTQGFPVTWEEIFNVPTPSAAAPQLAFTPEQQTRIATFGGGKLLSASEWTVELASGWNRVRTEVFTPAQEQAWVMLDEAVVRSLPQRTLRFFLQHRLLPEAYLYGLSQSWIYSQGYPAFLNGEVRESGWAYFFPYTFWVKTPLITLLLIFAAIVLGVIYRKHLGSLLYRTAPLWLFVGIYVAICCASKLNIGHRHLLPIYPPLFLIVGAIFAQTLAPAANASRFGGRALVALIVLLALQAVEVLARFPNYLAYFNGIVAPANGYRHLVDSSLDWGQELPAVADYLKREAQTTPVYLAYFGLDRPAKYGIMARPLFALPGYYENDAFLAAQRMPAQASAAELEKLKHDFPEYEIAGVSRDGDFQDLLFLRKPQVLDLQAGTYLIGATVLQPVYYRPWSGEWTGAYEADYQALRTKFAPYLTESRIDRFRRLGRDNLSELQQSWIKYREVRFARLTAYLRKRAPDDEINFAVLVYKLTPAEITAALEGPPPF